MNQFGTKYLQVPPQFFHLLVDEFFQIGRLHNLVADMDVHEKPRRMDRVPPAATIPCLASILLLFLEKQAENEKLLSATIGPASHRVPHAFSGINIRSGSRTCYLPSLAAFLRSRSARAASRRRSAPS